MRALVILLAAAAAGCGGADAPMHAEGPPMSRDEYRLQVHVILEDGASAPHPALTGDVQADLEAQYHDSMPAQLRQTSARLRALRPPLAERDVHDELARAFATAADELEEVDLDAGSSEWHDDVIAALEPIDVASEKLRARGYHIG